MVAAPAVGVLPGGTWATRPSRSTFPVTDLLPGRVICARSPVFTSPCCDGSRSTCTSSVSDVASRTRAPGRAVHRARRSPRRSAPARAGRPPDRDRSDPVRSSPSLDCSFSSATAVPEPKWSEDGSSCARVAYPRCDQVGVELGDVAPASPSDSDRYAGVEPHSSSTGSVVHPIEHVAAVDLVAVIGQLGVDAAGPVDHGVRRAVRSRPIGQGPVQGDHVREPPRSTVAVFAGGSCAAGVACLAPDMTTTPPATATATRTAAPASTHVFRVTGPPLLPAARRRRTSASRR